MLKSFHISLSITIRLAVATLQGGGDLTGLLDLLVSHLGLSDHPLLHVYVVFLSVVPPLCCILDSRLAHIRSFVYETVNVDASERDLLVLKSGPKLIAKIVDLNRPMLDLGIESMATLDGFICGIDCLTNKAGNILGILESVTQALAFLNAERRGHENDVFQGTIKWRHCE